MPAVIAQPPSRVILARRGRSTPTPASSPLAVFALRAGLAAAAFPGYRRLKEILADPSDGGYEEMRAVAAGLGVSDPLLGKAGAFRQESGGGLGEQITLMG
jgi:hypothetical protein